jgi:hypothetical protein
MVIGVKLPPVTENVEPVTATLDISSGAEPSSLSEIAAFAVAPTGTLPKSTPVLETTRWPVAWLASAG